MKDASGFQTQELLYSKPPRCRFPLTREPLGHTGPRRLPPAPTSHPAARFIEYNSVLCPESLSGLSRCLLISPSHPVRQASRQARPHPSRQPLTPLSLCSSRAREKKETATSLHPFPCHAHL